MNAAAGVSRPAAAAPHSQGLPRRPVRGAGNAAAQWAAAHDCVSRSARVSRRRARQLLGFFRVGRRQRGHQPCHSTHGHYGPSRAGSIVVPALPPTLASTPPVPLAQWRGSSYFCPSRRPSSRGRRTCYRAGGRPVGQPPLQYAPTGGRGCKLEFRLRCWLTLLVTQSHRRTVSAVNAVVALRHIPMVAS